MRRQAVRAGRDHAAEDLLAHEERQLRQVAAEVRAVEHPVVHRAATRQVKASMEVNPSSVFVHRIGLGLNICCGRRELFLPARFQSIAIAIHFEDVNRLSTSPEIRLFHLSGTM